MSISSVYLLEGGEKMKIECEKCKKVHDFHIEWNQTSSYERQMGHEVFYEFGDEKKCSCGTVIEVYLEGSEYPVGDEIYMYELNVKNGKVFNG